VAAEGRAAVAAPGIGRPLPNHRAYALHRDLEPALLGAEGELYLAGAGLARGYLGRPALTAERFLPDPFAPEPGARMYRTGDLVRQGPDGGFEFVGRADDQVKIRAGRVELGEIEHALAAHPAVAQAAVLAAGPEDARRLVAFVVPRAGAGAVTLELRRHLQGRLPAFMVPAEFAVLDALPLTVNGKVDRRALRERAHVAAPAATDAPARAETPGDAVTERLSRIWGEVLRARDVRMADDFFDLGGDSLLAVALVHEIGRQLGVELPVSTVFRCSTVAELAGAVRERAGV
jgi:acyl-coenzyme A synthetase/AMP-(fatty) acid ligase/acyl carrier protein